MALTALGSTLLAPLTACSNFAPRVARPEHRDTAGAAVAADDPSITRLVLGSPSDSYLPTLSPEDREQLQRGELFSITLKWPMDEFAQSLSKYDPEIPPPTKPTRAAGRVLYQQADMGFQMDHVFLAGAQLDAADCGQEINRWQVAMDLIAGPDVVERATLDRVMGLVSRLQQLGWQRFIPFDQARLGGRTSYAYKIQGGQARYALDPSWTPNAAQWREIAGMQPRWQWVGNGVHLELAVLEFVIMGSPSVRRPEDILPKSGYYTEVSISTPWK